MSSAVETSSVAKFKICPWDLFLRRRNTSWINTKVGFSDLRISRTRRNRESIKFHCRLWRWRTLEQMTWKVWRFKDWLCSIGKFRTGFYAEGKYIEYGPQIKPVPLSAIVNQVVLAHEHLFKFQQHNWIVVTKTAWPKQLNIFVITLQTIFSKLFTKRKTSTKYMKNDNLLAVRFLKKYNLSNPNVCPNPTNMVADALLITW